MTKLLKPWLLWAACSGVWTIMAVDNLRTHRTSEPEAVFFAMLFAVLAVVASYRRWQ